MSVEAVDAQFTESTALAVREDANLAPTSLFAAMRPAEKVAYAAEIATALKGVLVAQGLVTKIRNSEHVRVEGWQTAAALCGISARVAWTKALDDGSGWVAHAEAVRIENGVVVGAGDGMCSRAESSWKSRDDFALRAMAQTRAVSRALRGVLAFIIVLAGYEATPAEEMVHDAPAPSSRPVRSVPPPGPTLVELHAQAGAPEGTLGKFVIKHIDAGLGSRSPRVLSADETARVRDMLGFIIEEREASSAVADLVETQLGATAETLFRGAPSSEPRDATPAPASVASKGLLFARLSEHGYKSQIQRHAFAKNAGVALPQDAEGNPTYAGISAAAVTRLLDALDLPAEPAR